MSEPFFFCNHNHLITVDWSVYLAYLWLLSYAHCTHTWHAVHSKCGIVLANVRMRDRANWTNSIAFTFCQSNFLSLAANLICEVKNINEYSLTCVNRLIKLIGEKMWIFWRQWQKCHEILCHTFLVTKCSFMWKIKVQLRWKWRTKGVKSKFWIYSQMFQISFLP